MQTLQNLVWLVMLVGFTILPAVRQWLAAVKRKALIARLEQARGTKVLTMIHRQTPGLLGSLSPRYIDLDDSERIMDAIRAAGDKPIDLLLHTPGGLVIAAEQIARVLHGHSAGVTVIVPQYAMSGGTLLALAADRILMDENAMLGPIDPQLDNYPAVSYLRVLQEKEINAVGDQTIIMADMAEKAVRQVRALAVNLLRGKLGDERANAVALELTDGRYTHDYPIHVEHAREMGLPVSTEIPPEFLELLGLSQPAQQQIMRKAGEKGKSSKSLQKA